MTISLAQAEACQLLRQDLYRHLDEAEYLAMKTSGWDEHDAESAREVIPDLVEALRNVVLEHDANIVGRCRVCHYVWPCATVQRITDVVKAPERSIAKLLDSAHEGAS